MEGPWHFCEFRKQGRLGGRRASMNKTASQILTEDARRFSLINRYDVFLSHAYEDADLIHSIKSIIETLGLNVYVDWIDDADWFGGQVTTRTAKVPRERMKACSCLVYADSSNATESA